MVPENAFIQIFVSALESIFHTLMLIIFESSAKSRPPTTFVFSYAVTKNCNITVLWLLPWYLFSCQFWLPSGSFLLDHAHSGMSLLIYMHLLECIIHVHPPVVYCVGILLCLCVSLGFTCFCCSSCEVNVFSAVYWCHWYFSDTSCIHPNFLLVFPVPLLKPHKHVNLSPLW